MAEDLVRQSVLDRLIGTDLVRKGGSEVGRRPQTWQESAAILEQNVLRDVEALLNTRQISTAAGPPYVHLPESLYNYGLMDITTLSADSALTAHEIRRYIKESIERFEPRLSDVEVVDPLADEEESKTKTMTRTVRFRVEATLRTDPDPEHVEFDTILELASKRFEVSKEGHV